MKVKFVPQNVEFEIKPGQSVMHLAEDNGIYVKSVCRGVPSCAECRVKIVEGENNVFPPAGEELSLIGTGWFIDRRRLACQLQCLGDVTVDMSEQIAKQQGLIGGRKSKLAKAVGDRIEDETVIRDSSAEAREPREDRRPRDRGDRGGAGGGPRAAGPQPRAAEQPRVITPANPAAPAEGGSGPQPRNSPGDQGPREGGGGRGGRGKRRRR